MPVRDIVQHATCELRDAFFYMKERYPNFRTEQWAVAITLTPKVDGEVSGKFGYTGQADFISASLTKLTWTLGSPGLDLSVKGRRDGGASFNVHAEQLLNEKKYPLDGCSSTSQRGVPLSQYLGIREWLERLVPDSSSGMASLTNVDKPSFSSQIIVKFNAGSAGATFFVANASTFSPSLFGSVTRDITLSIAMTPDPKKPPVNTLPKGAIGKHLVGSKDQPVSPEALDRLDRIQQEQILRNLRLNQ